MFDTLDACAEAWKRAGNHGAKADRIARNLRWMRYYAQINDPTRADEAEKRRDFEASGKLFTAASKLVFAPDGTRIGQIRLRECRCAHEQQHGNGDQAL